MPWTEEQLHRIRDRLSMAKRQGVWLSVEDIWVLLDLIQFWRRSTRIAGHDGAAQGMLPTIAECRTHGITGFYVECRRPRCGNRRRLSFDEVRLPDSTVFIEIGRPQRFRCHRCGSRETIVSADWPRPKMGAG